MSEMVERVVAAMSRELGVSPNGIHIRHAARAAIEAMREPTEAMVRAGDCGRDMVDGPPTPDESWAAMIDAALNETA